MVDWLCVTGSKIVEADLCKPYNDNITIVDTYPLLATRLIRGLEAHAANHRAFIWK